MIIVIIFYKKSASNDIEVLSQATDDLIVLPSRHFPFEKNDSMTGKQSEIRAAKTAAAVHHPLLQLCWGSLNFISFSPFFVGTSPQQDIGCASTAVHRSGTAEGKHPFPPGPAGRSGRGWAS